MGEVKYEIYSYDVWGNKKEGYEVNDVFLFMKAFLLPHNATNKRIIMRLVEIGFLAEHCKESDFIIEGDEDILYITRESDFYPICELRKQGE